MRRFVFDPDGRIIGEYGTSATDVKAEHLWLNPEAGEGGIYGGDDGTGGYTPLAIAQAPAGGTATLSWVHANHLGHPLLTTNASGASVTLTGYTALGFPGQIKTLADLWYNRHRDYDPSTGRYIQADPIGLAGDANPYGYAGANPLGRIDPDGKFAIPIAQAVGGFVIAVAGAYLLDLWWQNHPWNPAGRPIWCPPLSLGGGSGSGGLFSGGSNLNANASGGGGGSDGSRGGGGARSGAGSAQGGAAAAGGSPGGPGDDDDNGSGPPAPEKAALDIGKQIERDLGRGARREFHDMKGQGMGDRTMVQLKADARQLYGEAGKSVPKWLRK
jgi:RHS repeat-associated protein